MKEINSESPSVRSCLLLVLITSVSFMIIFLFFPPIPQWLSYHQFADTRRILGIPNFWNVVSNAPFFLVGILGFIALRREWFAGGFVSWVEVIPFFLIFFGLILTSIGSSYYHLGPDNYRLVWDRIPMTIVFMSLVSLAIMERINLKVGFWLLFILILFGIWSVWYWIWTESFGRGDLRPYGFVQFYAISLILIMIYLFPNSYPSTKSFLFLIFFYAIATIFEFMDTEIYEWGGVISGHTLKHFFAGVGAYWFVVMVNELEKRKGTLNTSKKTF